ncbi:MAG: DUF3467 domain-containing protein [Planctomycetes bacterium]|nr:DUF3467 domain-containing protein [Planctomycetota bacterium]
MSKATDKPEEEGRTPAEAPAAQTPAAPAAQPQQRQQQMQVKVDDTRAIAAYANFCRVTGTPEELIIDFGLNSQPFGPPTEPIVISQRIITNFFTAKRMLQALMMTLQRHESAFGVLETDVQKRVMPSMRG